MESQIFVLKLPSEWSDEEDRSMLKWVRYHLRQDNAVLVVDPTRCADVDGYVLVRELYQEPIWHLKQVERTG